jgi:hypothetical protein
VIDSEFGNSTNDLGKKMKTAELKIRLLNSSTYSLCSIFGLFTFVSCAQTNSTTVAWQRETVMELGERSRVSDELFNKFQFALNQINQLKSNGKNSCMETTLRVSDLEFKQILNAGRSSVKAGSSKTFSSAVVEYKVSLDIADQSVTHTEQINIPVVVLLKLRGEICEELLVARIVPSK